MPNRDGTGPDGQGPRTGGQRGGCPAPTQPTSVPTPGQGPRDGRGRGQGRRCRRNNY